MENLKKISKLHEELMDKEGELADLMSEFEGKDILYKGLSATIMWIDPGNDIARLNFEDGSQKSVDFDELY